MSNATITFPIFGDNFAINISNYLTVFGVKVYWYGVLIALGFILAVAYVLHRCKDFGLTSDNVVDMLIFAVPISIVCARLYYVAFNFSIYKGDLLSIFKIWNGGLAIYGAIIGAVLTVVIFCRIKKISIGAMLDVGAFGLLIGQAVGRWGNFINREAYGTSENIDTFFLRMGLTDSSGETLYVHPTFLYESLWNVVGFILLHFFSKKFRKYDGQIFALYVVWYGLGRFLIEGLRTDSLYLFGTGIRVSQLVAILSLGIAGMFLLYNRMKREMLSKQTAELTGSDAVFDSSDEDDFEETEYDESDEQTAPIEGEDGSADEAKTENNKTQEEDEPKTE